MMPGGIGHFGCGRTVGAGALAVGVVIALLVAVRPAAAEIPAQEVKPLVLLLLDTSGSMEYALGGSITETLDEDSMLIPDCSAGQRSRWIVAQEVLTGTYGGYGCTLDDRSTPGSREDHNYPVPHVVPSGVQLHDGLIDMTIDRFKYGVMTFDAVPNPGLGGGGGWSYGPENGVNLGARNDTHGAPGGFVHPAASENPADVALRNAVVQQSILSAIPYGGTPIAPMLRDALYYFETDPDQQPWDVNAGTGDKYLGCRSRNIILVTDGRSNLGEGTDGYLTSVEYARRLKAAGITIYVIGFHLPAGVSTQMDDIADAGGTGEAFLADTAADLVSALVKILGRLETHVQSRTRVVVTEETGHDRDLQYQFNAGYGMVMDSPGLRRGYLDRTTYRCKTGFPGAVPYELQSLHAKLDATPDADRRIWTVVEGELVPFVEGFGVDTHVSPDDLDVTAGSGWLMDFSPNAEGLCRSGLLGNASDDAVRAEFRDNLVSYIRARDTSCRAGNKLGAIVHSSPTILAHKKNIDINVPSFRLYKESDNFRNRPVLLFAGSHDGMLHAFRVDRTDEPEWGREEWAVIPRHLLRRLKDLPGRYVPLFDGAPVVRDVLMFREPDPNNDNKPPRPETEAERWRAVLVSGYGKGGRGYIALDLTEVSADNREPKLLWEISNEGRCVAGEDECFNTDAYSNDFRRLGWSTSRPDIGVVHWNDAGIQKQFAVAVFGGGSGEGLECGAGKTVFVVRLDTGEKIAEFPRPDGAPTSTAGAVDASCSTTPLEHAFDAAMTGSVTCYQTFPGTFISRCFLGDEAGQLWRIDLGSPCPVGCTIGTQTVPPWKAEFLYDPYHVVAPLVDAPVRAPVFEAPAVTTKPYTGELLVGYAGSDTDQLDEIVHRNFMAAVLETRLPMSSADVETLRFECTPRGRCQTRTGYIGTSVWQRILGHRTADLVTEDLYPDDFDADPHLGERVMGPATVFSNGIYFTTFTPDRLNPCKPGFGRLYGVDAFLRGTASCRHFRGRFEDDPATITYDPRDHKVLGSSIPFGVAVVTRPACSQGESFADAKCGSQGGTPLANLPAKGPDLVVQTSVQGSAGADTLPTAPNAQNRVPDVVTQNRGIMGFVQSLFLGMWGAVFD